MKKLSDLSCWRALRRHCDETKAFHLRAVFEREPERFSRLSIEAAGLFLDYSKNCLSKETLDLLIDLAGQRQLNGQMAAMFAGKKINNTENRAVLHTALRSRSGRAIYVDGHNVMPGIENSIEKMAGFVEAVHSGRWRGYSGKRITDIVNIGIGGSYLGPRMVVHALAGYAVEGVSLHFVSNVDGEALSQALKRLSPESTLFIIASKTFTTLETMMNARSARRWFLECSLEKGAVAKHFVAVSNNFEAVVEFGIDAQNSFELWDWVGGRYSLWSSIGLSIALAVGMKQFEALLEGAYRMDEHFRTTPFSENMPVIMALVGIWNRNFLGASSYAVLPYDQRLSDFSAYLQQCDMESNGKVVSKEGAPVSVETAPVVWGGVGTNGQHAFYQFLHQGTETIPVDFIVALRSDCGLDEHHKSLVANCFAQAEALMKGKTVEEAIASLKLEGVDVGEIEALAHHKTFRGNRPSNMILMDRLQPETLGALIALYEHKVFVQGVIWGVNSFDQWGVELGKQLASTLFNELNNESTGTHDCSTSGLLNRYKLSG